MSRKLLIIAAVEREVAPLVRDSEFRWRAVRRFGSPYRTFECEQAAVVCCGMGTAAAARVVPAALAAYTPELVISAGLAGALSDRHHAGQVVKPGRVVDAISGTEYRAGEGETVLVTATGVASKSAKCELATRFGAEIIDMEAAVVAAAASSMNVEFRVIKGISDEFAFDMPDFSPYITPGGRFMTGKLALRAAFHPSMWRQLDYLRRNSRQASLELCRELRNLICGPIPQSTVRVTLENESK